MQNQAIVVFRVQSKKLPDLFAPVLVHLRRRTTLESSRESKPTGNSAIQAGHSRTRWMSDATELVNRAAGGSREAVDELFPLVYEELRTRARGLMRRERNGHTLQPTALVNEAYSELVDQTRAAWNGKTHFVRVASLVMHRILLEYARRNRAKKRGGDAQRVTLGEGVLSAASEDFATIDLLDALEKLESEDENLAAVVKQRLLGGLNHKEIAEIHGVTEDTVGRWWRFAKAKLWKELGDDIS